MVNINKYHRECSRANPSAELRVRSNPREATLYKWVQSEEALGVPMGQPVHQDLTRGSKPRKPQECV